MLCSSDLCYQPTRTVASTLSFNRSLTVHTNRATAKGAPKVKDAGYTSSERGIQQGFINHRVLKILKTMAFFKTLAYPITAPHHNQEPLLELIAKSTAVQTPITNLPWSVIPTSLDRQPAVA